MRIKEVKVIFDNQSTLSLVDQDLKTTIDLLLNLKTKPISEPLALEITSTGKILIFDRNLFEAFNRNEIKQEELILRTSIAGLYRNNQEFTATNGLCIDVGGLWKLVMEKLFLVDDDIFIEGVYNKDQFDKII